MTETGFEFKPFPWYEKKDGKLTTTAKEAKEIFLPEYLFGGDLNVFSKNLPRAMVFAKQTSLHCAGPLKILMWSKRCLTNLFGQGQVEADIRLKLKQIGMTCIQTLKENNEPIELYFNPDKVVAFLKAFE